MPTYEDQTEVYDFDPDTIIAGAIGSALLVAVARAFEDSSVPGTWVECDLSGDRSKGSFVGGDGEGNVSVLAWEGRALVAFEYRLGFGPAQQLDRSPDALTRGPEDVRGFVPGMPAELEGVFQRAAALLRDGPDGAPAASAGLWVTPESIGCSVFGANDDYVPGREILRWGVGPDDEICDDESVDDAAGAAAATRAEAVIDDLASRAGPGRTTLTKEEAAAILATGSAPRSGGLERMKSLFAAVGFDWPA